MPATTDWPCESRTVTVASVIGPSPILPEIVSGLLFRSASDEDSPLPLQAATDSANRPRKAGRTKPPILRYCIRILPISAIFDRARSVRATHGRPYRLSRFVWKRFYL